MKPLALEKASLETSDTEKGGQETLDSSYKPATPDTPQSSQLEEIPVMDMIDEEVEIETIRQQLLPESDPAILDRSFIHKYPIKKISLDSVIMYEVDMDDLEADYPDDPEIDDDPDEYDEYSHFDDPEKDILIHNLIIIEDRDPYNKTYTSITETNDPESLDLFMKSSNILSLSECSVIHFIPMLQAGRKVDKVPKGDEIPVMIQTIEALLNLIHDIEKDGEEYSIQVGQEKISLGKGIVGSTNQEFAQFLSKRAHAVSLGGKEDQDGNIKLHYLGMTFDELTSHQEEYEDLLQRLRNIQTKRS